MQEFRWEQTSIDLIKHTALSPGDTNRWSVSIVDLQLKHKSQHEGNAVRHQAGGGRCSLKPVVKKKQACDENCLFWGFFYYKV